ncbi:MAG: hypothetical protein LBU43_06585 [Candidatus Accumulibacter sp.]|jgi:hypothetical protein|nr:hypothetical protein [Accumulibacter sp.]
MVSINLYTANTWNATSSLTGVMAIKTEGSSQVSAVGASDTSSISTLARQLSEAAERAAVRDAGMSREQLAKLANALLSKVAGEEHNVSKAINNAEVPDTDDPELLKRAEQATKFVNNSRFEKNPFAGLSREQLSLIIYDEGNAFTVNERYAAYYEYSNLYNAWAQKVCAQAWSESEMTGGKTINFFKACIAEYQAASLIEQSTYHPNYVSRMEHYIQLWEGGMGINYKEGDTLIEMLLPEREYDEHLSWGLNSWLSMPESFASIGSSPPTAVAA